MSDQLDALERELIALGHDLVPDPPPEGLAAAVLERITDDGTLLAGAESRAPERRRAERRPTRRLAWAITAMVVVVVALVPPVRAAVMELLHIGGVVVRQEPGPPPSWPSSVGLGPLVCFQTRSGPLITLMTQRGSTLFSPNPSSLTPSAMA